MPANMSSRAARSRTSHLLGSIDCFAAIFAIIRYDLQLATKPSISEIHWLYVTTLSTVPIAALLGSAISILFNRMSVGIIVSLLAMIAIAGGWGAWIVSFYLFWL
jgi:hypothetical protein